MARYEGMDEILDRMRQRLLEAGASGEEPRQTAFVPAAAVWKPDAAYTEILDCMLGLLREAERLEGLLRHGHVHALSCKQGEALRASLANVLSALLTCEELLHQSTRTE